MRVGHVYIGSQAEEALGRKDRRMIFPKLAMPARRTAPSRAPGILIHDPLEVLGLARIFFSKLKAGDGLTFLMDGFVCVRIAVDGMEEALSRLVVVEAGVFVMTLSTNLEEVDDGRLAGVVEDLRNCVCVEDAMWVRG